MEKIIEYLLDLRILIGALAGAIGMFFYAQKNPEWVQKLYQKQRGLSMQGTEEIDKLKKQIADMELDKRIEEKFKALQGK
jgi:predicted ATPase with chaperone activity